MRLYFMVAGVTKQWCTRRFRGRHGVDDDNQDQDQDAQEGASLRARARAIISTLLAKSCRLGVSRGLDRVGETPTYPEPTRPLAPQAITNKDTGFAGRFW